MLTPLYDLGCRLFGYGRAFKEWVAHHAPAAANQRILDVGAGTGVLAHVLLAREATASVVGVDPDRGALRIACRGAPRPLHAVLARGEALPLRDGTIDLAFSTLALHHVPDAWRGDVLREVRRVLRPDGCFVLADFENHLRLWVPRRFASARRLEEWIAEAGFETEVRAWRRGVHLFRLRPSAAAAPATLST